MSIQISAQSAKFVNQFSPPPVVICIYRNLCAKAGVTFCTIIQKKKARGYLYLYSYKIDDWKFTVTIVRTKYYAADYNIFINVYAHTAVGTIRVGARKRIHRIFA